MVLVQLNIERNHNERKPSKVWEFEILEIWK